MAKFAANLTMMFTEVEFLERFEKAAQAGFKAVEFLFPYDYEPEQLAQYIEKYNLEQTLFNLYPGDWVGGEKGFAALPGEEKRFKDCIEQAIPYAVAMKCQKSACDGWYRESPIYPGATRRNLYQQYSLCG
nr:TIM barrel protein [Vibrio salinus]